MQKANLTAFAFFAPLRDNLLQAHALPVPVVVLISSR
jgi:hypothetical protein